MQKHVNLVDLVKSFPTNIFLQNLASIQKRTSPIKFSNLAEKSENYGSISNLSTKPPAPRAPRFTKLTPWRVMACGTRLPAGPNLGAKRSHPSLFSVESTTTKHVWRATETSHWSRTIKNIGRDLYLLNDENS